MEQYNDIIVYIYGINILFTQFGRPGVDIIEVHRGRRTLCGRESEPLAGLQESLGIQGVTDPGGGPPLVLCIRSTPGDGCMLQEVGQARTMPQIQTLPPGPGQQERKDYPLQGRFTPYASIFLQYACPSLWSIVESAPHMYTEQVVSSIPVTVSDIYPPLRILVTSGALSNTLRYVTYTSHHIASHNTTQHITSHHITSHHITSHHITSYHIISYPMFIYI